MGILGLSNLVYFGEHYPEVFHRLVAAQGKRDYPLACAGINVTAMLCELLNLRDEGRPEQVQRRSPLSPEWDSDMLVFFCHMFYRERPFEDMYCFSLRALDRIFVLMDANCADFPSVMASLRARLQETLAQRPLSFREFKRLVNLSSLGDNESAYSGRESTYSVGSSHFSESGSKPDRRELGRVLADVFEGVPKGIESAGRATERLGESLASSFRDLSTRVKGWDARRR